MSAGRRLWPREYGAYAELGFPLLTVLLAGRPGVAAVSLSLAAFALFLLHEPLLVWRGTRGERLQRELGTAARVRMRWLVAVTVLAGTMGITTGPPSLPMALLVPGAAALLVAHRVLMSNEKTLGAELLMALAFAGMTLPVGLAAGLEMDYLVGAGAVWLTGFAVATLLVHAIKAWHREPADDALRNAAPIAAGVTTIAAITAVRSEVLSLSMGLAALPTPSIALIAWWRSVHPRRLRRVGWAIVAGNTASLILLLLRR